MTLIERLAREAAPCQGADYGETCEAERCLPCHVCAVRPAIEAKMRELVEATVAIADAHCFVQSASGCHTAKRIRALTTDEKPTR